MSITNWSIEHWVTVLVFIVILSLAGYSSYVDLPREAAPDITIPVVVVSTPYVGVAPSDMEKLVTQPLEDELQQLKDVRSMRSTSTDGVSIITIEFEPDVDIDNALQKIRERVDAAQSELPTDLTEDPIIQEISFSEFPIMIINLSSAEVGLAQLKLDAERLQNEIEKIDGILEVKLVGSVDREISIEADPKLLEYFNVTLGELTGAIRLKNLTMPGGQVKMGDLSYTVRVPAEFRNVDEIEEVIIREAEGEFIRVKDVAVVRDTFQEAETYSRVNGLPSLSLSVTRRAGENILRIAEEVKAKVAAFQDANGGRILYSIDGDISKNINERVEELENNILTGLILVAGVLLFFMGGLRNALFVAAAIPLSMLVSFAVLAALEITLNIVVLFSLVLALGMLVDNAIVIVENIYRHGSMGKSLTEAARDGTAEVAWPVIASTATTVFGFFPLMFWPGIMGEFMSFLPLTVIIVLLSSLFVALVINPVLCALFMKIKKVEPMVDGQAPSELDAVPNNFVYRLYGASLKFSLKHRWLVALGVTAAFVATFMLFAKHNYGVEFFPETTPERIYVNVTLPDGTNLDASNRAVLAAERTLLGRENIDSWSAAVGAGNGNQFSSGGSTPNRSRITVEFKAVEERKTDPKETVTEIRDEVEGIVGADIDVIKENMGPPTGAPINIELVGADYQVLGQIAEELRSKIEGIAEIVNLKDDFQAGRSEITVHVDPDAASAAGLNTQDIANTVRMAIAGVDASVFRDEADEYDIVVRLNEDSRNSLEDLRDLYVKNKDKDLVPITEVATIVVERGYGSIRHVDTDRVVTVSADVTDSQIADAKLKEVQKLLDAELKLPAGYDLRYTGQNKEQAAAQVFLTKALLAALFLIALVLVTQFNSVIQPFIIMCSVVLSLLGVLWILMLRQQPFGIIMTGVGLISLAGVVVNNAIVLIDYINQLKARGMGSTEAIYTAGMVRFRPVMLTAVTTILSLMPIVLGFSLDVKNFKVVVGGTSVEMWGGMGNAVAAGLTVATLLTLIVVPVMYSATDSITDLLLRRKRRPTPPPSETPLTVEGTSDPA